MGLLDETFLDTLVSDDGGGNVSVTIRVDGDCFLRCDGDFIDAEFKAGQITKIELSVGQHILEFQLASDPSVVVERIVDYPERGKNYLEIVRGLRPKTDAEKKKDAIADFEKKVQESLEDDKRIDSLEAEALEDLRQKLGLDQDTAARIINEARRRVRQASRTSSSAEGTTFSLDALKEAVFKDDEKKVRSMLPDMASAVASGDQGSAESKTLQCWYHMCLTALQPADLIKKHESSFVDNYWRTYWVVLAYSRNKQRSETVDTLADLASLYAEYPEGNIGLLRAVDALNHQGKKEALACMETVGTSFSPELLPLVEAIKLELGVAKASSKQAGQKLAFIQERIVSFETPEERAARKEKEKEALRKKLTYTVSIIKVTDAKSATATMKKEFGWAPAVSTHKLAKLPLVILVTEDAKKAESLYETLEKGGIRPEIAGVNALGEAVKDCLGLERKVMLNRSLYVIRKDSLSGYMDKTGKEVIPCQYDMAYNFHEGLARVEKDGRVGFIDKTGEMVIDLGRDYEAYDVSEGMIRIRDKDDKSYGFMNTSGKWVITPEFDDASDFEDGLAWTDKGFVNPRGCFVSLGLVADAMAGKNSFSEGLLPVKFLRFGYGYVNKAGRIVIQPKFSHARAFREGFAIVKKDDKYSFIDKSGKEISDYVFYDVRSFHEGVAAVAKKENGKTFWGYINTKGQGVKVGGSLNVLLLCGLGSSEEYRKFNKVGDFHDGMAVVRFNGKFGYLERKDNGSISMNDLPKYDMTYDFYEGLGKVELDGKYGYIDKDGNVVGEIKYDIF